jgi:hypothetical protein
MRKHRPENAANERLVLEWQVQRCQGKNSPTQLAFLCTQLTVAPIIYSVITFCFLVRDVLSPLNMWK